MSSEPEQIKKSGEPNKKEEEPSNANDEQPDHSNALVIRDGFPALMVSPPATTTTAAAAAAAAPGENKKQRKVTWWIEETDDQMKLPRHSFWSHDAALSFSDASALNAVVADCHKVFSARTRDDNAAYSAGTTYFLPALMKPRCALESLVQTIFQEHVKLCPGMYKPESSGAEWWTLVMGDSGDDGDEEPDKNDNEKGTKDKKKDEEEDEEEDEVGWHYDADYGLEDQAPGLLLHPRVATVTYLSNCGAPTVILDCKTPKQGKVQHLDGQQITKAWVSYPRIGKHAAFDGRLLHGAPADVFPSLEALSSSSSDTTKKKKSSTTTSKEENEGYEPPAKRIKVDAAANEKEAKHKQRVTLLVNVWLNHCPIDAELLDDDILEQMESLWKQPEDKKEDTASNTTQQQQQQLFHWNSAIDMAEQPQLHETSIVRQPPPPSTAAAVFASKDATEEVEDFEDEVVLCNHRVNVQYGATLEDYRLVAQSLLCSSDRQGDDNKSSIAVDLGHGALTLRVGDPVSSDDEEEEADEAGETE